MKVGDDIEVKRASWTFGGEVADTFVDHAAKSIPLYHEGHELVCGLSDYFVQPDGYCYELGTSTGQLIRKLAEHNSHKEGTTWVGLDREETMIEKAREHCAGLPNVELHAEDFFLHDMQKADFIVSYYVLQFVPPRLRQDAFDRIYERLNWGGALVLFEKVRGPDARFQDIANNMYTNFKNFKYRILVSTDIWGRGIDVHEHVLAAVVPVHCQLARQQRPAGNQHAAARPVLWRAAGTIGLQPVSAQFPA